MSKPLRTVHPLIRPVNGALVDLPAPVNISYWWNFGSLLGLCLVIQLVSGIFLAMHYTLEVSLAYESCVQITRNVNFGWLVRSIHANGAAFFFFCMYMHIGRGLYYGSYSMISVWLVGVVLYIMTMATAFLGYVLVWGQMSMWAATVITSLLSAIPLVGEMLVEWIWGAYSVSDPTLHRFFIFHFILPFLIAVVSAIHLVFLHGGGSNNPLGLSSNVSRVPFHPYFTYKDVMGFSIFFTVFGYVVFINPDLFSEPENFILANCLVTPNHIQPEWYFLWLYAILRAVPNKLGGVVALFMGILILGVFPLLLVVGGGSTPMGHSPFTQFIFWLAVSNFLILTWLGSCPAEEPFNFFAQLSSITYFSVFVLVALWNNIMLVSRGHMN